MNYYFTSGKYGQQTVFSFAFSNSPVFQEEPDLFSNCHFHVSQSVSEQMYKKQRWAITV